MISPAGGLRIYVATRPTGFRKGIDGLALVVQETMGLDPFSGAAFVFRTKRADRIKVLVWDQTGIVLVHSYLTNTLLDGHPKSRIDELMPSNFSVPSSRAA
ncbi:MAG: IS66 family insertion sequence element accessory protein TnpB [Geminicoccaceae bacterium]